MPTENRTPEDAPPLARPVSEEQLARPAGSEQEEAEGAEEEREEAVGAEEQAPQPESREKGPIEKALDKAQENGWVYDSVANQARERGLVSKADEAINKARSMLADR